MWLPLTCPPPQTWPATQACVPAGNQTSDPSVLRLAPRPLSHTSQGWITIFLIYSLLFLFRSTILCQYILGVSLINRVRVNFSIQSENCYLLIGKLGPYASTVNNDIFVFMPTTLFCDHYLPRFSATSFVSFPAMYGMFEFHSMTYGQHCSESRADNKRMCFLQEF